MLGVYLASFLGASANFVHTLQAGVPRIKTLPHSKRGPSALLVT